VADRTDKNRLIMYPKVFRNPSESIIWILAFTLVSLFHAQLLLPQTALILPPPADVRLLIDISGSMKK